MKHRFTRDLHPRIDYDRQQQIVVDADAGRLDHPTANHLIRASWPPCCGCGAISSLTIAGAFYCDGCGQLVWRQEVWNAR